MSRGSRRMVFFVSLFALLGGKQVGAASISCLRYRDLPLILPLTVYFITSVITRQNLAAHLYSILSTHMDMNSHQQSAWFNSTYCISYESNLDASFFPEQSSEAVSRFQLVCSRNPDRPRSHHNTKKTQLLFSPTPRRSSLQTWFDLTLRMNTSPTWS